MTKTSEPVVANLEDMIRAAAANGELSHLSLAPVAGKGPGNIAWSASYSPASVWGSGFGHDVDPVVAIKKAMTDEKMKGIVKGLRKTLGAAGSIPEVKETTKASAAKAVKDNLPADVDDADFV